ncbi:hypothetical protein L917_20088 [Phytophthora nicotianae]|uniref:Uncharacterized protein n=1 Tax=Phytophthora nicotianae TaxID=4792 RepID=W2K250_PHYNI|nr:hypothetical protein L917_20088 [Phytophthora nicotianae]
MLNRRLEHQNFSFDLDTWKRPKCSHVLNLHPAETRRSSLEKVREALVLLAAVVRVDNAAIYYLLKNCCEVKTDLLGGVDSIFPLNFAIVNIDKAVGYQLVELCGTKQRNNPRKEYIETLKEIADLSSNLSPDDSGVGALVSIQLIFQLDSTGDSG